MERKLELWKMIDPITQKKLTLLEQIKEAEGSVSIQTLADFNNWGRETVQRYLDLLWKDWTSGDYDGVTLIRTNNQITLNWTDYRSFYLFRLTICENSIAISVLRKLLLGETVSLTDSVNHYFVSESTFKRRLLPLKAALIEYELTLSSHHGFFFLQGEEHQIRVFAYNFFWKLYKGCKWPFTVINEQKIAAISNYLLDQVSNKRNDTNNHQIWYVLAINLTRYRRGFELNWTDDQLKLYFSQDYLAEARPWLNLFQLPEKEILFFFLLTQTQEKVLSLSLFKKAVLSFHETTNSDVFKATELFFHYFSEYIVTLSKEDQEKHYTYIFANHLFSFIFPHFSIGMSGFSTSYGVSNQFPVLANKLVDLLEKLTAETHYPLFENRDFLIPRYALFCSLLLDISSFEKTIVVYVETDYPEILENHLIQIFYDCFHHYFKLKIVKKCTELSQQHADLVLTTSLVPMKEIKADFIYFLSGHLLTEDLIKIETILRNIRER
ncbi:helix-turn-helix domain-containing protein [Vagococcus sp. BWB3-3]|uniref:Helix-turn-helix domain-containing protein n=1 Tax=Vagococcus allomyrinae TaxID=2794353 RepID=A0A940SUJ2_9ENTE|nr:helix-turn-helix domain-containing protein [Vagococcus allomyrinae]MBP1040121.1 helix-turn-helix domain-containing protein [Vagococcus allomyrinae]